MANFTKAFHLLLQASDQPGRVIFFEIILAGNEHPGNLDWLSKTIELLLPYLSDGDP